MRLYNGVTNTIAALIAAAGLGMLTQADNLITPQGRLSAGYVPYATGKAQRTVYYIPLVGCRVPIPMMVGGQQSFLSLPILGGGIGQALSDATKSPAAAAVSQVYDLFLWLDTSQSPAAVQLSRGPAWSAGVTAGSNTVRGAGAGSTAIVLGNNGLYTNAYAITNGPAAGMGLHVGTIMTDAALTSGSATFSVYFGGAASGGGTATVGLWNRYNQIPWAAFVADTTVSYTYATSAYRAANNSPAMSCAFVIGDTGSTISGTYNGLCVTPSTGSAAQRTLTAVGIDSTTAPPASFATTGYNSNPAAVTAPGAAQIVATSILQNAIGVHTMYALENGTGNTTYPSTIYGTANTGTNMQGLMVEGGMW